MPSIDRKIEMPAGKFAYFVSDFHFGIDGDEDTLGREKIICQWLDSIKSDAHTLFLMGDIWDAWMEYKLVVPKGNTRFLGKLAELSDQGVQLIMFSGNHDLWLRDYFRQELNMEVIHEHQTFQINNKIIRLGHGDGIGPGDARYKLLKKILRNPLCQWIYRQLHPDLGLRFASYLSKRGPKHKYENIEFLGNEKEFQIQYAQSLLVNDHYDYFIFGHRHIPNIIELNESARYINLGDWLSYKTYARLGENVELNTFSPHTVIK
jgi:UDP-2,3-diacylglucosamine hydrolase